MHIDRAKTESWMGGAHSVYWREMSSFRRAKDYRIEKIGVVRFLWINFT